MLAGLVRRGEDFDAAEDALQEALLAALLAALQTWPGSPPRDPRAWLATVATRRLVDARRSAAARSRREEAAHGEPGAAAAEEGDDTLLLLFRCCSPDLPPASQVALTLRAVGGLTAREIADAFYVPEATMAQRISRAKRAVAGRRLDQPGDLAVVLRVLYLVYAAGHAGRADLAGEAIRLARQLTLATEEPEARGLLALLLLNHARLPARRDSAGRIVPLDRQDRSLWDTREIAEGVRVLQSALASRRPGRYQIEAAIAALHDDAPSAQETDWPQILAWYDDLVALTSDPVHQDPAAVLARAVAVGHVLGATAGLHETDRLRGVLGERHRWHAVRGHLYELAGDLPAAGEAYADAARRAPDLAERDHLVRQAARARAGSPSGTGRPAQGSVVGAGTGRRPAPAVARSAPGGLRTVDVRSIELLVSTDGNRRFVLRQRPVGRISPQTFELVTEPVPDIGEGEALVRVELLSLDPAMRGWLNDLPSYLPPVQLGEVMRGSGVGRVVASKHPEHPVGQRVVGMFGWQEWAVLSAATMQRALPEIPGVPPSAYLGVLGTTGLTAWVGLDIGRPQPGETVVVSAAAGAVGSVAAQLARQSGARVVGIAGGPDKCAVLTDRLGLDAAVDHTADDWPDRLAAATPHGIDVDFENVGGDIMDAVFGRLNVRARVVLCGLISAYNATERPPGPTNFQVLLTRRVRLQGFIVLDHLERAAEFHAAVAPLVADGQLTSLETVVDGFAELPNAVNRLFDGTNLGKLLVRADEG